MPQYKIEILYGGAKKNLRNFNLLLPKFHFILPKFHFPSPWGKFVCSVELPDFLGREEI